MFAVYLNKKKKIWWEANSGENTPAIPVIPSLAALLSFSCSSLMHARSPDAFSGTSRTQKRRRVNVHRAGEGVVKTQTKEK